MKAFNEEYLERIVRKVTEKKYIHGAVFQVNSGDGQQSWSGSSGNIGIKDRYYIASINKLFVSAIVLQLIEAGQISLEDRLATYLPGDLMRGLHVYRGQEHSDRIQILHLLSQTSGLPCYLTDQPSQGMSGIEELEAGIDRPWPVDKVIEWTKTMDAHFPPGKRGKAKYIDTNHQLLNLVIEELTGMPVQSVLEQLFDDLNMTNTYVCRKADDTGYVLPYYKEKSINIGNFLASTGNDIISTVQDQMIFIRSFFNGHFYPQEKLKSLEKWSSIFFPFQYGIGIQKFYTPRYLAPLKPVPDMIGHCGSTGSVAYYIPAADLFITGTTNQQAKPGAAFQIMIKIVHALQ